MKIHLISLRSGLSKERDDTLDESSKSFLKGLEESSDISFTVDEENADFSLLFVESGGSEAPFLSLYKEKKIKGPYYLLATGNANSLASSLEILSFLGANKEKGEIVFGSKKEIVKRLQELYFLISGKKRLSRMKLALIGAPSDWLIASSVDFAKAKERFGITLINIPVEEVEKRVKEVKENEIKDLKNEYAKNQYLDGALKIYLALRGIVKDYGLDGFSLRCFSLLNSLKNTACLALSRLNKEGIIASCEGDAASLITMAFIRAYFDKSSFQCNPSAIDLENKEMILAHCAVPLDMVNSMSFMTHYESGIGIGIRGELEKTDITLLKIKASLDAYRVYEGHIEENLTRNDLCRTQIRVKFHEDLSPFIKEPYGNHLLGFYGRNAELVKMALSDK